MSVSLTNSSKTNGASIWPIDAIDSGNNFSRIEPLVTPEILKKDWLFAVPLHDTRTNTRITDEDLKRVINRAMSQLEMDLKINIIPVRKQTKLGFDWNLFKYYGYLEVPFKPITTLISLSIEDASFNTIYTLPPTIIETRFLYQGRITFGPITVQTPNGQVYTPGAASGGGSLLLLQQIVAQSMPAFWLTDFICGWPENRIPTVINELIAITAAIEVLSKAQVLFKVNSQSLSHDGLSSSSSGPGPRVYLDRINDLKEKKAKMVSQVTHIYYNSLMMLNV